ncbi:hypothetical protein [Agrobacterium rosae]|uniref:Uncharacterized protein n=1 Tax=Agrobacterium rosae TaxID=1972867 RepID=A0AAE5RU50_9HYPH|nr:hypothetical protein [Agrobacterium rosae]KAA3511600.1 hypothetical protein DXM21_14235 [Agrobacterium rosae]KAA3518976.1 hypothetical protein DXM25_13780 [Agrobacterium rosae]MCM2433205.1 hypothetical protein [Agrobacterium rosae]MQB49296.1 hypothetical protein [Agrobacterium rosae]POO49138.1 hypothetical protein CPJ18_22060 [Agrobacterium rosae]
MITYADLVAKHAVKTNKSAAAFSKALTKQIDAVKKGQLNRRSWAKEDITGFHVKLGKLEDEFHFQSKEDVLSFFDQVKEAVRDDSDFVAKIEELYGDDQPVEAPKKKRGPKPKSA